MGELRAAPDYRADEGGRALEWKPDRLGRRREVVSWGGRHPARHVGRMPAERGPGHPYLKPGFEIPT